MAEAEQDGNLASTKQPHTLDVCIQGEHRQDAACLQVPQAQLSWIIIAESHSCTWRHSAVYDMTVKINVFPNIVICIVSLLIRLLNLNAICPLIQLLNDLHTALRYFDHPGLTQRVFAHDTNLPLHYV